MSSSNPKKLEGRVISDKMSKTVVVEVIRLKPHRIYKKYMKISKHYKAHDEDQKAHVGDKVTIQETRPISKQKRWVIVDIKAGVPEQEQKENKKQELPA